jgi:CheY-like chemotaxis protein/anti-sigma regulatory factor (Ser/Thr protein kinase)
LNQPPVQTQQSSLPKRILVIDPVLEVHEMLSRLLPDLGWDFEEAPDNSAALTRIETQPFDLIITAGKTSGKEDIELLQKIRRVRPHTRMIILTDKRTPEDVLASMRERAFSYFSEPFSMELLADMIRLASTGSCWDDGIEVLAATPEWVSLAARCDIKTADRLLQFLREITDLSEEERRGVGFAFREMLLNAIEHGGHFDPNEYVEISYVRTRHAVVCRIKDPGEGFSLDEIKHAAVANPPGDPLQHFAHREAQGLRPGGFGVMIAKQLVDDLVYNEKGNEVLLIKQLANLNPAGH